MFLVDENIYNSEFKGIFMKIGLAILLTIVLIVVALFLNEMLEGNIFMLMMVATGIWAAWDSSKIELKKYKSGISYGPIGIFVCHIGLWFVAFPWYLSMRYKIKNGLAQLKQVDTAA